ncbi:MAG: outer membrane protein transport protein [bacterium]
MRKLLLFTVFTFFVFTTISFASGFQINECGARAMAMGGAFTGLANDPSAAFYNPAGITQLSGTQFSVGVSLIAPSATFTGPTPSTAEYKLKAKIYTPFNVYFTHQLSDKMAIGLSVNNPYGLGTQWEDEKWAGRYLAVDTEIQTFFFSPVFAYKINEQFSVGAGVTFAYGNVTIKKNIPVTTGVDGVTTLEGNGTSWGFNVGLLWKPAKEFSVGLDYRSQNKFDFEGTAETSPATYGPYTLPHGDITAPLTTPQNIVLGLAFMPTENLTFVGDFQYVGWESYDKLEVTFKTPLYNGATKSTAVRDYENCFIARIGCEYLMNPTVALRGGIFYDKNPVKDELVEPTLTDADRIGFNIGLGYKFTPNFGVDFSYLFLYFPEREITNSAVYTVPGVTAAGFFNGTYKPVAHLVGINFSYSL